MRPDDRGVGQVNHPVRHLGLDEHSGLRVEPGPHLQAVRPVQAVEDDRMKSPARPADRLVPDLRVDDVLHLAVAAVEDLVALRFRLALGEIPHQVRIKEGVLEHHVRRQGDCLLLLHSGPRDQGLPAVDPHLEEEALSALLDGAVMIAEAVRLGVEVIGQLEPAFHRLSHGPHLHQDDVLEENELATLLHERGGREFHVAAEGAVDLDGVVGLFGRRRRGARGGQDRRQDDHPERQPPYLGHGNLLPARGRSIGLRSTLRSVP